MFYAQSVKIFVAKKLFSDLTVYLLLGIVSWFISKYVNNRSIDSFYVAIEIKDLSRVIHKRVVD